MGKEGPDRLRPAAAEPTKIFFDMLFDYRYLKYIFKYGFYWDDDITKSLLSKSSQRVRELFNVISESVYENCVSAPWCEYADGGRKKKSGRLLVRQNHYRLVQNRWFQDLCGCCGNFNDVAAEEAIDQCERGPYSCCRDEGERTECSAYRKLCMFKEERETFLELLDGVAREEMGVWKSRWVHKSVSKAYGDIIDSRDTGGIILRKNSWGDVPEQRRLADMVWFLSGFTPMSVLGWNFLKKQEYRPGASYIMVRNLPMEFEFEQEYLYRCLYAMNKNKAVIYEEKAYTPVKLFYRDKDMAGVKEHLYLEAVPLSGGQAGQEDTVILPLFGGVHVRPAEKAGDSGMSYMENTLSGRNEPGQNTRDFRVEFYYNDDTEYLRSRRREGWGEHIVDTVTEDRVKTMESPYYKDNTSWSIDVVTYRIEASDIPGFLLFIRSFGDFAKLVSQAEPLEGRAERARASTGGRQKGMVKEYESLLSVYNSDVLIEAARDKNRLLPPRQSELQWLDFVLREYPGFCGMFLKPESIEKLKEKLRQEREERGGEAWFDRERFDFGPRVKDLEKRVCAKYKRILDAMYGGRVLRYEYHDRQVRIFPYALEYDVTRHLAGGNREPMDIMCYDLDEKRTVNIPYKRIETRDSLGKDEYIFSDLEKLYHVLAYAVRCGKAQKREIDRKAARLLECMWNPDPRSGEDNYNRLIRKKVSKRKDFLAEYQRYQDLCVKNKKPEAESFFHRVFDYWKDTVSAADERCEYQAFLLSCFTDGCKRLWSPRAGRDVKEALEDIDGSEIWRLIGGGPVGGVVNEIAFYNENLKNAVVSFVLKEGNEESVEKVYNVFRNYICAGERLENGKLKFTVSYESFFYRKIHMALMALSDLIEEVEPEETAEIIEKRIKNKGEARS